MKRILLTGIAAAFFAMAGLAQTQQQKNRSGESNQYRRSTDSTGQRMDSVGNTIDSKAEKTGRDIKQDVKSTETEMDRSAEQAGQKMQQGADRAGNSIQQGAQRTGESMQNGADRAGNTIKKGTNDTGNAIQNGAERTRDQMNQGTSSEENHRNQNSSSGNNSTSDNSSVNGNGSDAQASNNNMTAQNPVEVVDSKEGPNNEVVYKYQGELYYVDRKEQKLVKADESQLKDAKNKAVVSTNPVSSTNSKTAKMKPKKSNKG
jgi:hypothetical protein